MSKKRGKKKGIAGRGGETLAEVGSECAGALTDEGSDDHPEVSKGERVDDVGAAHNDLSAIDDASANSLKQDQDEGSGKEGSSDSEWEDKEEVDLNAETKDDDDDDANCNDYKCIPNFDWTIEGLNGLNDKQIRHSNAFYLLLKKWLMTRL